MTTPGRTEDLHSKLAKFEIGHPGTSLAGVSSAKPRALVIRVTGILDTNNSTAFQAIVGECLGVAKSRGGLIIDLAGLTYASSAGIGALTTLLIETQRHGIALHLCRIPHNVGAVLDVLGFSSFFDQVDSYEVGE